MALSLNRNLGMPYMTSLEFAGHAGSLREALATWIVAGYHPQEKPTRVDPDRIDEGIHLIALCENGAAIRLHLKGRRLGNDAGPSLPLLPP